MKLSQKITRQTITTRELTEQEVEDSLKKYFSLVDPSFDWQITSGFMDGVVITTTVEEVLSANSSLAEMLSNGQ